jgi:Ni,Fe-hydrogenase maturation factor
VFKDLDSLLTLKDRKILFVGIGNLLKSDDGVGVYISKNIVNKSNISSLTVETGIENYIGKINSLKPDILVLIDCVDFNSAIGTYKLLEVNQIQDLTFNTTFRLKGYRNSLKCLFIFSESNRKKLNLVKTFLTL